MGLQLTLPLLHLVCHTRQLVIELSQLIVVIGDHRTSFILCWLDSSLGLAGLVSDLGVSSLGLMDSSLRLMTSSLGLMTSSVGLMTSSLGLMTSSVGLMASSLGLMASSLGLMTSSLGLMASSLGLMDSSLGLNVGLIVSSTLPWYPCCPPRL